MAFELKTCCGCANLRMGTKIIIIVNIIFGVIACLIPFDDSERKYQHGHDPWEYVLIGLAIIIVSGVAAFGMHKNLPSYLIPLVSYCFIFSILAALGCVLKVTESKEEIRGHIGVLILCVIWIYNGMVVLSLHNDMKRDRESKESEANIV